MHGFLGWFLACTPFVCALGLGAVFSGRDSGVGVGVGVGRWGDGGISDALVSGDVASWTFPRHLSVLEPALDLHIRMWKCHLQPSALDTPPTLHGGNLEVSKAEVE